MPPTTTDSGNANEQPALSAGPPPQERVVRGHLPAPTGGGGTNRAKILTQIPEAGHGMAAGCCCQLWAGSRRRGGQLPGCHLPPAAVHGCHSSQADCLPHTRMDGRGRPRQPEVLGGEAPAAELGRQAGCDRSRHWAVPEVVAAVRVRVGCAAAAGLGGRGHAGSDGEGVEHQASVDFLVLVVPGQAPQPWQQRRNRRAVGLRAVAIATACQRFKGCKPLLSLLLQAAELQLRVCVCYMGTIHKPETLTPAVTPAGSGTH